MYSWVWTISKHFIQFKLISSTSIFSVNVARNMSSLYHISVYTVLKLLNESYVIVQLLTSYALPGERRTDQSLPSLRKLSKNIKKCSSKWGSEKHNLESCYSMWKLMACSVQLSHLLSVCAPKGQSSTIILLHPLLVKSLCSFCDFTLR